MVSPYTTTVHESRTSIDGVVARASTRARRLVTSEGRYSRGESYVCSLAHRGSNFVVAVNVPTGASLSGSLRLAALMTPRAFTVPPGRAASTCVAE